MPQTRFVLGKAIDLGLKPIVVINKVDKENCRPDEVHEQVFDLMFNLGASEDQLDFVTLYGSSKQGWMSTDWKKPTTDITALLDAVVASIPPAPVLEGHAPDAGDFARLLLLRGPHRHWARAPRHPERGRQHEPGEARGTIKKVKIRELQVFEGLGRAKATEVSSGEICAVTGIEGFEIGDTLADADNPRACPSSASTSRR